MSEPREILIRRRQAARIGAVVTLLVIGVPLLLIAAARAADRSAMLAHMGGMHDDATTGALALPTSPLAEKVRKVNARFRDVSAAVAEGYAPIPCASGVEGGAMGIHYVHPGYLKDDEIDLGRPEAVMYEPQADGSMQLVAVEYITTKGPAQLEGQLFSFTGAPNRYGLPAFYELHVWAWRTNPTGTFADMNPRVSCDAARPKAG